MASGEDKKDLVKFARKGKMDGDAKGPGFKEKLADLVKAGITGPGHDYGLDWSDKPFYRPALWEATWKNQEAMIRLLLDKGATIDFADYQGRTPLHEAAYYGYQNLVEMFLEKGHPIDPLDNFGHSPLFRAVEAGRDSIVVLLVEKKASLNRLDTDGCTPQHLAGFNGMPDMGQWLLYKGAWKNRFSMEEQPPEYQNRASSDLAKGKLKKTMVTELDEEDDKDKEKEEEKEAEEVGTPVEQPKVEEEKASKTYEGTVEDKKPTMPKSQFSDP
mmetsp:Transcript_46388/g.149026  ORF Transcript_46388/g.149026 Transcript_46388/m.149026 type:complete len:272 (+) Transcript_46388:63-878(+)